MMTHLPFSCTLEAPKCVALVPGASTVCPPGMGLALLRPPSALAGPRFGTGRPAPRIGYASTAGGPIIACWKPKVRKSPHAHFPLICRLNSRNSLAALLPLLPRPWARLAPCGPPLSSSSFPSSSPPPSLPRPFSSPPFLASSVAGALRLLLWPPPWSWFVPPCGLAGGHRLPLSQRCAKCGCISLRCAWGSLGLVGLRAGPPGAPAVPAWAPGCWEHPGAHAGSAEAPRGRCPSLGPLWAGARLPPAFKLAGYWRERGWMDGAISRRPLIMKKQSACAQK